MLSRWLWVYGKFIRVYVIQLRSVVAGSIVKDSVPIEKQKLQLGLRK